MVSSVVQAQAAEVVGEGTEEPLSGPGPSGCLMLQSSPEPMRRGGTDSTLQSRWQVEVCCACCF